jgi:hypothetical protein
MTINVAVVSSEALVLGCDSISSVTEYFINPFAHPAEHAGDGRYQVSFSMNDLVPQVTNSWHGVTKMFALSRDEHTPVAAVTAGLARLNNRSMKSYADEFLRDRAANTLVQHTVEEVAKNFLMFMRRYYDQHYADTALPPELRDGPEFLVGGYDAANHLPCLYRVNVQNNRILVQYAPGTFGIAWEGLSDAVERLFGGYDAALRESVEKQITAGFAALRQTMRDAAARMLRDIMDRTSMILPEGVKPELPDDPHFPIEWENFRCDIAFANLPIQDSIDLAAYLVELQSGKARFSKGVATVGGRTHIGLIRKQEGFQMLNEPELRYTRVGST